MAPLVNDVDTLRSSRVRYPFEPGPMSQPSSEPPDSRSSASPMTVEGDGRSPVARATVGQFLFLLLGLLLFVVLFAVPLILLIWLGGAFYGSFGVAEMLERTHGLAPVTYQRAFWLAIIFTGLMALIEIGASIRRVPGQRGLFARLLTRPSTGLLLLFVPTIFLVRLDLRGTDIPDFLTTALLLCCLGYVYFILPLALLSTS